MADRPALPSIRVKLPSEGEQDFLQRYAPRIAEKGLTIPTANLRAVGSRIRLTLELKSGEAVSGEAVVESHLTGPKQALVVRFVSLDEGSIVFPFAPRASSSPPAARPPPAPPAPPATTPPPTPSRPPSAAPPAVMARGQEAGDLEDLFGPEDSGPRRAPKMDGAPERGEAGEASSPEPDGEEAGRMPGPPEYADEPRPAAARRRGRLLAVAVVIVAVAAAGVFAAIRAFQDTTAAPPPAPKAQDEVGALLAAADRDIGAGRLTGPESALAHLLKARAIAPEDGRVRERLKLLADTFEAFAERALGREDPREARVHLEAAEQADPGRASLAEKRARLEALPDPDAPRR